MEEYKDINGKVLQDGDPVVFEHDTYIKQGIFSHAAGTTVVIKNARGFKVRQIQKEQTNIKIYKI